MKYKMIAVGVLFISVFLAISWVDLCEIFNIIFFVEDLTVFEITGTWFIMSTPLILPGLIFLPPRRLNIASGILLGILIFLALPLSIIFGIYFSIKELRDFKVS